MNKVSDIMTQEVFSLELESSLSKARGIGYAIGIPIGMLIGLAMENIAIGAAIGVALGIIISSVLEKKYNSNPITI